MTTIKEKATFLQEAIEGSWTLFFEHDPQIEIADVEMTERGPRVTASRPFIEL